MSTVCCVLFSGALLSRLIMLCVVDDVAVSFDLELLMLRVASSDADVVFNVEVSVD